MRVFYRLGSQSLSAVAAEAAWAESMGYDGLSSNETAHDPFLPLALAAASPSLVRIEINSRSMSAKSPNIVTITLLCKSCAPFSRIFSLMAIKRIFF